MPHFELSDEEFDTIRGVFSDWGSDCPCTDYEKYHALGEKLGILEPVPEPTPEELKRREEFRQSPMGISISRMITKSNEFFAKSLTEFGADSQFSTGSQWPAKIGSQLRIRFPKDYEIKK